MLVCTWAHIYEDTDNFNEIYITKNILPRNDFEDTRLVC